MKWWQFHLALLLAILVLASIFHASTRHQLRPFEGAKPTYTVSRKGSTPILRGIPPPRAAYNSPNGMRPLLAPPPADGYEHTLVKHPAPPPPHHPPPLTANLRKESLLAPPPADGYEHTLVKHPAPPPPHHPPPAAYNLRKHSPLAPPPPPADSYERNPGKHPPPPPPPADSYERNPGKHPPPPPPRHPPPAAYNLRKHSRLPPRAPRHN